MQMYVTEFKGVNRRCNRWVPKGCVTNYLQWLRTVRNIDDLENVITIQFVFHFINFLFCFSNVSTTSSSSNKGS